MLNSGFGGNPEITITIKRANDVYTILHGNAAMAWEGLDIHNFFVNFKL